MNRPISDKEFEARWDAESLAKAEEIKADPNRLRAAQGAATQMAEEKRKELTGINRVANKAKAKGTARKSPSVAQSAPKTKPKTVKRQPNGFNVFKNIS